jgi:hypothetical protein
MYSVCGQIVHIHSLVFRFGAIFREANLFSQQIDMLEEVLNDSEKISLWVCPG